MNNQEDHRDLTRLAKRVIAFRRVLELTQEQIANELNIETSVIEKIERGEDIHDEHFVLELGIYLGVRWRKKLIE